MRPPKIAVAQPKKTVDPLTEAKKYIGQASREKADIVFFPVHLRDKLVDSLRALAKENEIYI